jgi:hypothetical protein
LAAAVAVEDQPGSGAAGLERLLQGVGDQPGAQVAGQRPADDAARAEVDDHREVEPAGGDRHKGDVPRPDPIGTVGQFLSFEEIGRGLVGAAIAGARHVGLGLDGFEPAFGHDAADPGGGAGDAVIGQVAPDPAVAVAAAMALEDGLDAVADVAVGQLGGGGRGGVIVAAAGDAEHATDASDSLSGGGAEVGWGLVPRMIAAFFKMSFSALRRASSRRSARSSSAWDLNSAL